MGILGNMKVLFCLVVFRPHLGIRMGTVSVEKANDTIMRCLQWINSLLWNQNSDCLEFKKRKKKRSHSTSSNQIAEPDPFRFASNFANVFIGPKCEILKIFGPLDPLFTPLGLFQ